MPLLRDKDNNPLSGWVSVPLGASTWGVFSEAGRLIAHGFLTKIGADAWIANNEAARKAVRPPGA